MATQRKAQSAQGSSANLNDGVATFLLELADYEKNVNRHLHKFNVYRKAAHTIAKHTSKITSGAEARKLEGVGDKIGKKIDEFLTTGKLQKLEKIRADPRNTAINELTSIAGIGPAAAALLVKDGITSIEELRKNPDKLNHHQRIGLKYHADFKERIPRAEMEEMERFVTAAAAKLDPELKASICGSYRRGAKSSGDVDVLICHPSFTSKSKKIKHADSPLHRLVSMLCDSDFITDEISHGESKFAGVCRRPLKPVKRQATAAATSSGIDSDHDESIPSAKKIKRDDASSTDAPRTKEIKTESGGGAAAAVADDESSGRSIAAAASDASNTPRLHRRLDIRIIPFDQYACGVLYFTGSDMFNKQMRGEALDVGFTLNEYSLRPMGSTGVAGEPVAVETERDIFDAIGMDFKEPWERNV